MLKELGLSIQTYSLGHHDINTALTCCISPVKYTSAWTPPSTEPPEPAQIATERIEEDSKEAPNPRATWTAAFHMDHQNRFLAILSQRTIF